MGAYSAQVIADGASHYWRLGEPSGLVAADSIAGGANAPGTISGGVTLGAAGPLADGSTAMTFDGATGQIVAPSLTLPLVCSLDGWLKLPPSDATTSRPLLAIGAGQTPSVYLEGSGIARQLKIYQSTQAASVGTLPVSVWVHWGYVLDGSTVRFYLNGVGDSSQAFVRTASTGAVGIGYDPAFGAGNPQGFLLGSLAEVAIYPTPLTPAQIANHYALRTATGGGGSAPPLPWPLALAIGLAD